MSRSRYVAAGVFVFAFSVLVATGYPAIGWWKTGFLAPCAENLGVPDPGGSILYVLVGRVFSTVLFFLRPVRAIALANVTSVSLVAVLFYFTLRRLIRNIHAGMDARVEIAAAAVSL